MFKLLRQTLLTVVFAAFASQASAMWIQADWLDPSDSRVGTNRYAYSFNDPVNNSDPGGNCPSCAGGLIGGILGGLAQGAIDLYNGELSSARTYGAAIAGGAAAGATFGLGSGATLGGLAARGALSGAAGTTTGSLVGKGQLPSATELTIGTGLGAVTGPLGGRTGRVSGRFTGSLDDLTTAERSFVQREVAAGRSIESIPTGNGRTADFLIDGVQTELKTISGVSNTTSNGISSAMASRIMDGRGQSGHIVVDLTGQKGVTREIAERGIARAYGADRRAGIQSIRAYSDDFDITVPRDK
jgi:hypothetical protein